MIEGLERMQANELRIDTTNSCPLTLVQLLVLKTDCLLETASIHRSNITLPLLPCSYRASANALKQRQRSHDGRT
jgi:hypothetical protein